MGNIPRGPSSPSPGPVPLSRDEEVLGPTAMELEAEPLPEPPVQAPSPEPPMSPPEETVSLFEGEGQSGTNRKAGKGFQGLVCCGVLSPLGAHLTEGDRKQ